MKNEFKYKLDPKTNIRDIDRWGILNVDASVEILFEVRKSDEYLPLELITIIQFLISNIKSNRKFQIQTDLDENEISSLSKIYFQYYHFLSILLFEKDLILKSKKGNQILTHDLYEQFISKLKVQEDLYSIEFDQIDDHSLESTKKDLAELRRLIFPNKQNSSRQRGFLFFIPCFDHLRDSDLDKSYYFYGNHSFKDEADIYIWLKRLFKYNKLHFELPKSIDDLSVVIKELFQNTHDWARTTYDNSSFIQPNIRATLINLFLEDRLLKKNLSAAYDPVESYLANVINADQNLLLSKEEQGIIFNDRKIGICEISVLDSGPGMACRLLEKDLAQISFSEECSAVIKCFHKYITSESSGKKQLRGRGLSKVLSLIGNKGLVKVRTGRVNLIRDFFKKNLTSEEISSGKLQFDDQQDLNSVTGTVISILYPFTYSEK